MYLKYTYVCALKEHIKRDVNYFIGYTVIESSWVYGSRSGGDMYTVNICCDLDALSQPYNVGVTA